MSGLNYGKNFRRFDTEQFPNEEGVFYSESSKNWVVRIINEGIDKRIKPFRSVAQFDTKTEANNKFKEIKNQK
ncbi:hypothetical protein [Chryseobacterium wangxinyae]|uniref:hypothetical protein n=1 Tax=Chryseobacterium sp. CY353 TaxID=2997334 RepID=UPI0022712550|nr:hypothetical protein [Chryseobacterium sp. CY353]MCY0967899.1 hypothetical protein [Chryseobacterium sp. CY353]